MGQIFSSRGSSGVVEEEEEDVNLRPAKRAKTEDKMPPPPLPPPTSEKASELISLLVQLNGGEPLDLAAISAINSAFSPPETPITGATTEETLNSTLNKLFTNHVGQSPQIVINHAIQFASDYYDREIEFFNETENRGGRHWRSMEEIHDEWFDSPKGLNARGPRPDSKVWLEMFLGEERVKELLDGSCPLQELHDRSKGTGIPASECIIWKAFKDTTKLPLCDLILNILRYVRNKSNECEDRVDILRFAVLHGLDGFMRDLIKGGYGDMNDDLTIDTLLELSDEPVNPNDWLGIRRKYYMTPLHLGAILGYSNIVLTAYNELGGIIDAPFGMMSHTGEFATHDHVSVSVVMQWVILNNMKGILKTLVKDLGFQFRWVFHASARGLIFNRLFELSEYESNPRWKGQITEEDYAFESSRVRCGMRSASAYKEQMKMFDYLIDLGFPFSLLFPSELPVDELERLMKEKKLETRKQNREYMKSLSKDKKVAIDIASEMASSYNSLKSSESEMLTLCDYYRMLKKKWEGKESQVARLDEFEALDPTWRAERQRQEERARSEDEKSYDESSYGSGSSYEFPGGDY